MYAQNMGTCFTINVHRLLLEYLASLVEGWSFVISCSGHRQVMFHDKSSHRQLVARVLRASYPQEPCVCQNTITLCEALKKV